MLESTPSALNKTKILSQSIAKKHVTVITAQFSPKNLCRTYPNVFGSKSSVSQIIFLSVETVLGMTAIKLKASIISPLIVAQDTWKAENSSNPDIVMSKEISSRPDKARKISFWDR